MAASNVEIVREIYSRWGSGDFRGGTERYDADVELVMRHGFPETGVWRGPGEIARFMREQFLADLEDAAIRGEEFTDAEGCVVVAVHQSATGPGSGVPVEMRYYQVWTLRAGRVTRIENIRERAEALAAAGLAE
jgi:ketosteroid isomerase-like protein